MLNTIYNIVKNRVIWRKYMNFIEKNFDSAGKTADL